jgi:hypothetical protein
VKASDGKQTIWICCEEEELDQFDSQAFEGLLHERELPLQPDANCQAPPS